ncbi:MAG: hypothetical protein GY696_25875, partial [Gammaproteobacteria bacterium]|nr:hypothetical protein [Gammaproteobacteria bacterium]
MRFYLAVISSQPFYLAVISSQVPIENAKRWCPQPTRRPGACSYICGGPANHHAKEKHPGPYEYRRGENRLRSEVDIKQNSCMPSLQEDSEPSGQGTQEQKTFR